jgi:hypothetical protein
MEYEEHSVCKMPSFNAKSLAIENSVTIEKLPSGVDTTIQLNNITTISDNNGIYGYVSTNKCVGTVACSCHVFLVQSQ